MRVKKLLTLSSGLLIAVAVTTVRTHALVVAPIFALALIKVLIIAFGAISIPVAFVIRLVKKNGVVESVVKAALFASGMLLILFFPAYILIGGRSMLGGTLILRAWQIFAIMSVPITATALLVKPGDNTKNIKTGARLWTAFCLASMISIIVSAIFTYVR